MNISFDEIRNFKLDPALSKEKVNQLNLTEIAFKFGYNLKDQKSTEKWLILKNPITNDKIAINTNPNNQWYFNPHDDLDKGKVFNFLLNRINNNLNVLQNPTGFELRTTYVIASKLLNISSDLSKDIKLETKKNDLPKSKAKTLLNILKFNNTEYLNSRNLTNKTITAPLFKDKIFNSKVPGKNNGLITNTAFPLINIYNNEITGWTTRNKKYKNKQNDLINPTYFFGDTNALWLSNKPLLLKEICFAESEIDALSYYQINKTKTTQYISFDGNLNNEKQKNLVAFLLKNLKKNNKLKITSITDNDLAGYSYDFKIFSSLVNAYNNNYTLSFSKRKEYFNIQIFSKNDKIDIKNEWKKFITPFQKINEIYKNTIDAKIYKKNENDYFYDIKINTQTNIDLFKKIFSVLQQNYLPKININLQKAQSSDWNDDLKLNQKKNQKLKI